MIWKINDHQLSTCWHTSLISGISYHLLCTFLGHKSQEVLKLFCSVGTLNYHIEVSGVVTHSVPLSSSNKSVMRCSVGVCGIWATWSGLRAIDGCIDLDQLDHRYCLSRMASNFVKMLMPQRVPLQRTNFSHWIDRTPNTWPPRHTVSHWFIVQSRGYRCNRLAGHRTFIFSSCTVDETHLRLSLVIN